jgi:DNA-binding NtrC family response regulator
VTESPQPTPEPQGPIRVLYVDDEPTLAKIAEMELGHMGCQVTALTSSLMALELIQGGQQEFDVVCSDISMPEMPGDELVRKIHRLRPDLPIVLITGYDRRLTASEAQRLNIIAFFQKPFSMEDLHNRLRQMLRK